MDYSFHEPRAGTHRRRPVVFALVFAVVACPAAIALTHSQKALLPTGQDGPIQMSEPFQSVGNFIAAYVSASAKSGSDSNKWGLWVGDPGSEGKTAPQLKSNAPQWYNPFDWWKEEHDLIMPNPVPLPAGKYKVYGDTTQGGSKLLTIETTGNWSLEPGVTIDDVTHHPCKAFRYMGTQTSGCG